MLTTPTLQTIPVSPPTTRRSSWDAIALAIVATLAHLPLLTQHAAWLWQRPHYQFFPLVLIGAGVLAVTRIRTGSLGRPRSTAIAAAGFSASWLLLALADLLASPWLGCVAFMTLLPTLVYAAGGKDMCRQALPAWVLLWLVIPPPLDLDRVLMFKLQNLTTEWSSALLDVFGVFHFRAGNVIEVDGKKLMVEEACSGINSLYSLLSCTLFLVFLTRRGWGRGSLLIAAAIAWVLAMNVARVTGVVLLETRWGVNVSTGWRHEVFGILLFSMAVGLLLSTDQLFSFLTRSVPQACGTRAAAPGSESVLGPKQPLGHGLHRLAMLGIPAFLLLLIAGWATQKPSLEVELASSKLAIPDKDRLPKRIGPWDQAEFAVQTREAHSFYGEQSSVWRYSTGRQNAVVSLDYPFPSWHDLTWCYTAKGWHIDAQSVRTDLGVDGGLVEVSMTQPTHRHGYLLFGEFNSRGQPLSGRPGGIEASFFRHQTTLLRLRSWLGFDGEQHIDPIGPVYQFQVFWEGYDRLPPEDEALVTNLFVQAQAILRESLGTKR